MNLDDDTRDDLEAFYRWQAAVKEWRALPWYKRWWYTVFGGPVIEP